MTSGVEDNICFYTVGSRIERLIDGIWFAGEVIKSDAPFLTIRYDDDCKVETNVQSFEVRPLESIFNFIAMESALEAKRQCDNSHLLKPLQGLVEDDSELRRSRTPKVILHAEGSASGAEKAVVILGAKETLAVGTGLMALRYLKT